MPLPKGFFVLGALRMACELGPVSQDRKRMYFASIERRLEFGQAADDAPDAPLSNQATGHRSDNTTSRGCIHLQRCMLSQARLFEDSTHTWRMTVIPIRGSCRSI